MTLAVTTLSADRSWTGSLIRVAQLRAWLAHARPGERLEYHRGLLALDRANGMGSLTEAQRRKLAAIADDALVLAGQGRLHLLQERHGDVDYSYWAVVRTPSGSVVARMRLPATAAQDRIAIGDVADPQAGALHHPELSMAAQLPEHEDVAQ